MKGRLAMKMLAASLAGLATLGGGAMVASPSSFNATRTAAPAQQYAAPLDTAGTTPTDTATGQTGEPQQGREGRMQLRHELRQRTMNRLGITPQEMLAARKAEVESMVAEGKIPQAVADRMLARMQRVSECIESGKSPQECRPQSGSAMGERMHQQRNGGQGQNGGLGGSASGPSTEFSA